jgi:hypothetical protein
VVPIIYTPSELSLSTPIPTDKLSIMLLETMISRSGRCEPSERKEARYDCGAREC